MEQKDQSIDEAGRPRRLTGRMGSNPGTNPDTNANPNAYTKTNANAD